MIARWIVVTVFLLLLLPTVSLADVRPYLEVNGHEVSPAPVQISRTASEITAVFQAPREGIYSFGISILAAELLPLYRGCSGTTVHR